MVRWMDFLHFAYAPLARRFHFVESTATARFDAPRPREVTSKRPPSGVRIASAGWPALRPRSLGA